ncbi:MAG: RNA polymerase sigma factor [Flavobacteriales bacterium Tduv]
MNSQKNIYLISVIRQAKKGERKGQSKLMKVFWSDVYHYILKKTANKEEAEDISIESFTKVFNKLELYKEELDFRTWLISIAQNTMLDHIRKRKIQNISLDQPSIYKRFISGLALQEHSPEEILILKQFVKKIQEKINQLPPKYQKIIRLRFLEEKTYKEIAEHLQVSMSLVKIQLLRAKKLLSKNLRPEIYFH